jgi:hypothetical protein
MGASGRRRAFPARHHVVETAVTLARKTPSGARDGRAFLGHRRFELADLTKPFPSLPSFSLTQRNSFSEITEVWVNPGLAPLTRNF